MSDRRYQIIESVIQAGATVQIPGEGDKFYFFEASGTLTVKDSHGTTADFVASTGAEVDSDSEPFTMLQMRNPNAVDVTFKLFYGYGKPLDGRKEVTVSGAVTVTNSALPAGAATNATLATLAKAAQLPAALDDSRLAIISNALGAHANGWNAVAVLAGGVSAALDTKDAALVSAFGNADAATTISLEVSQDGATWYATGTEIVLAGPGDFHLSLTTGAKHARLKSSGAALITATLAAKA